MVFSKESGVRFRDLTKCSEKPMSNERGSCDSMRISLILATVGRTTTLERFLDSLNNQSHRDFELIVVDQNPDNRVPAILDPYRTKFSISYYRSPRGLSRARNVGLEHVTGEIIGFPDDDCWYLSADFLNKVAGVFSREPQCDGLTGPVIDEDEKVVFGVDDSTTHYQTIYSCWRLVNSNTLFVRHSAVSKLKCFDETIGVGSGTPWGSGEDVDFVIRLLKVGLRCRYDTDIVVGHPSPDRSTTQAALKAYQYGLGGGYLLRKHRYPAWFVAQLLVRPLIGCLISPFRRRTETSGFYLSRFRGRLEGYLKSGLSSVRY